MADLNLQQVEGEQQHQQVLQQPVGGDQPQPQVLQQPVEGDHHQQAVDHEANGANNQNNVGIQQNNVAHLQIITAASKYVKFTTMIKLCSTVLNAIKTVTDSCNMREFYKFIKSVTRVGAPFITSRHFHDLVQQKCDGKFSRMCTAANNDPTVAAARALADHQEDLHMQDLTRDTPQGNEPVPPGNYHAPDTIDAHGDTVVNSYFKLWTSAMTADQQISWLTIHAQLFQQSQNKMKDSESVATFVDRTLRTLQEDWQSTLMPKIPDWLLAHMMFANLTVELKNDMNEVYASYFQNGQRSFQSWCYADVFSMATKCESSPKFQAENANESSSPDQFLPSTTPILELRRTPKTTMTMAPTTTAP